MPVLDLNGGSIAPVTDDSCEAWPEDPSCECSASGTPEQEASALAAATEVLWALSGRQFGLCELVVRPCRMVDLYAASGPWSAVGSGYWPHHVGGQWVNVCGHGLACSCSSVDLIVLPGPVAAIVEVKLDGEAIPTGSYRVDDGRYLLRTDGGSWPTCQNLDLPATEDGTMEVTYLIGLPVPIGGQRQVSVLKCEMLKSCLGLPCKLPQRVTTVSSQGVTTTVFDTQEFLNEGRTGIPSVDLWLIAVNPNGMASRSRATSPDSRAPRRQTWPT